jgi:histidine phosphotransfer protein HptB
MYVDEAYFKSAREKMIKRFQIIIDAYFEECSSMIDNLKHAESEGDIETMTRAAHSIKSTSAALGAQKISQLAASIEARYASGDIKNWEADKAKLEQYFQGTKEEITRLME